MNDIANAKIAKSNKANQHIEEYLKQYIEFSHPPYFAVLLEGPWGSGKTHLIKKFVEENISDKMRCVYVSLYGLSSLDDLEAAIFQAIYPALMSKTGKVAGKVIRTALKFKNIEIDLKASDFLNKFKADVFIFDDLERSEMSLNQVMGYINEYVEHDGCKVIILANEKEIHQQEEYLTRKEKLIGRSFVIQSDLDNALEHFIQNIDDLATKKYLMEKKEDISSLYFQSEIGNLRILQQTLWDFERLHKIMTIEQSNSKSLLPLLRLFFALSFEYKSGRLKSHDLSPRHDRIALLVQQRLDKDSNNRTSLQLADARYPETNLFDQIISDDLIIDFLQMGTFDREKLQRHFDITPPFAKSTAEPAWRTVWHMVERTDTEFNSALDALKIEFQNRAITETGIILHLFGIHLKLSKAGIIKGGLRKIVSDCKKYVDDIYKNKTIQPMPLNSTPREIHFRGYDGLGFHEENSEEFLGLFRYLDKARTKAREDQMVMRGSHLLDEMESDADLFFRRLNMTNSADNIYHDTPILESIDSKEFVRRFLSRNPYEQRTIMLALHSRFRDGQLEQHYPKEKKWLAQVQKTIRSQLPTMSAITRYRLSEFLEWFFTPLFSAVDPAGNEEDR